MLTTPWYYDSLSTMYLGFRILEDKSLVEMIEDWSNVRSPARARRRRQRGFPQNVVYRTIPKQVIYEIGGNLVMHPEIACKLKAAVEQQNHVSP